MSKYMVFILLSKAFNDGAVNRDLSKDGEQYAMDVFRKFGISISDIIKPFKNNKNLNKKQNELVNQFNRKAQQGS